MSRNFHRWARRYGIRDGDKPRPVLLNNWEATGFNFDEERIVSLFDGAKELGAETFLLDDGWFGNGHPRNDDHAGLGDWQVNTNKLPHGLSYLSAEAKKRGVNFGIWIEPEMVNPNSDLFEQHPEWAIGQPHRQVVLGRNQRVLDLSRPEVRDFTWSVIENTLGPNPGISYVKWDCNCYVTQPGSTWLKPEQQSHLLIDYQHALYEVMGRMASKYPGVMVMLCSGGAGRLDYGALKFFHSFWPSDNTDPARRVIIQWGFSHFFPAETIAAHVTRMGRRPIKFALDVGLSGALGLDMDVAKLTPDERRAVADAVSLYKQRLREVVQQGDLYRLESPYSGPRSALNYVSADKARAVLFVYALKDGNPGVVRLRGLEPTRHYRVREVNLPAGVASALGQGWPSRRWRHANARWLTAKLPKLVQQPGDRACRRGREIVEAPKGRALPGGWHPGLVTPFALPLDRYERRLYARAGNFEARPKDEREGKAPTTQAGEFVREEIHHIRQGKHGAKSPQQAIAIGLSKARRAGVKLPPPARGRAKARTRKQAKRDVVRGRSRSARKPNPKRSRAVTRALNRAPRSAASRRALSRQARSAARRRASRRA